MTIASPETRGPAGPSLENLNRETPPKMRATTTLIALAALGAFCAFLLPTAPGHYAGWAYIAVHFLYTALMAGIWIWAARPALPWGLVKSDLLPDTHQARISAISNAVLWGGVAFRIFLLPADFFSSNDVERYLWDGAVTLHGFDPYTISPDHSDVVELRALWATPPEHAKYPTLYPPGALLLFSLSALAGPVYGVWLWKVLATAASIAALILMRDVLARRNQERHLALIAFSPLLLLEVGVGAHLDVFIMLSVVAAIAAFDRQRDGFAGAALGLGAGVKFLPIILIAPISLMVLWADDRRTILTKDGVRRIGMLLIGAAMPLIVLYGGAVFLGMTPIGVLPVFFEKWRGGSPVYSALSALFPSVGVLLGQAAIAGVLLVLAFWMALRKRMLASMALLLSTPLAVSPVVFPWYLSVLAPFAALCSSVTILAWLTSAPLIYEVLNGWRGAGVWSHAIWPLWVIAFSVAVGFGIDRMRSA